MENQIEFMNGVYAEIFSEDHTASVVKTREIKGDIIIPRFFEHKGEKYTITNISNEAFSYETFDSLLFPEDSEIYFFGGYCLSNAAFKKLQIPPKLKYISENWCWGMKQLVDIEVSPKNNYFKYIDNKYLVGKSYDQNDSFNVLYYARYDIEEAQIPPEIKTICNHSFQFHPNLKSIILPKNSKLETIINSFGNTPISKLVLPSTVQKIDGYNFINVPNLVDIQISKDNQTFSYVNKTFLLTKSDSSNDFDTIIFCRRDVETVKIPSYIRFLGLCSFNCCTKLRSIEFEPNSILEKIETNAFSDLNLIKNICFPPSVNYLCSNVFGHSKSIESIDFLCEKLTLDCRCFEYCRNPILISLPNATELKFYNEYSDSISDDFIPEKIVFKIRRETKLIANSLSVIQKHIQYFEGESDNDNENENVYLKIIRSLEKKLSKYEKVVPFDPSEIENTQLIDEKKQNDEIENLRKEIEKKERLNKEQNEKIKNLKKEIESLNEKVKKIETKNDTEAHTSELEILKADEVDLFKVIKTIGRGAQSEVFEVSRENRFALKVLYIESSKKCVSKKRTKTKTKTNTFDHLHNLFQRYEVLNLLNHKNVIRTFGFCFGDEKHSPSILLQFCPNNLNDVVDDMSEIERVCAIYEISLGMEAVHASNLMHRDLKPANILIDENGHIKISDFGVSCLIDTDNQSQTKIAGIGSMKFMAPELLNEKANYNNKVDVYSFGVVVFFILTGGKMPKISMGEQSSGKKAQIPKGINRISKELINKCWSMDAKDRPSFTEIIDFIKSKKFKLIDGVEKSIDEIKAFLSI